MTTFRIEKIKLVAERESFTSSVFAVLHGHNIILYCEPVP